MKKTMLQIPGGRLPVILCKTAVLGSGAAGWAAAWRLAQQGGTDPVLVCDDVNAGTSRNAGSDKQTYYRLGAVGAADSVEAMAADLFDGGATDGDIALAEAALSTRCFYALTELGVPFPCDRYGRFVGYRTDHDPAGRASSVGPYTSRAMTQKLQAAALAAGVPVAAGLQAVRLLQKPDGSCGGVLCLDADGAYTAVVCSALVLATGGPADIWQSSVYPQSQTGASGMAFEAGAGGRNLTEWQFGLASLAPRWNVSGSYMQVLPRFFSVDKQGNEIDFLAEELTNGHFADMGQLLSAVFLKGYQWPFDARRVQRGGSSLIDLAVLRQQQLGRSVYLDFTREPFGKTPDWHALSPEARGYLQKADALQNTPYARLLQLNAPAVDFYADQGVDLAAQPLPIGVCAQHCNGGLAVDAWYRTGVAGLFAIGEAAATHGVRRPGGSALNAGQVGALRAAQYIAVHSGETPDENAAAKLLAGLPDLWGECGVPKVGAALAAARTRMDGAAALQRDGEKLRAALAETQKELAALPVLPTPGPTARQCARLRQLLVTQCMVLAAMADYAQTVGVSRGSALYRGQNGSFTGEPARGNAPRPDETQIQEIYWKQGTCTPQWRAVRPVPCEDTFFENVWRDYRADGNIR